MGAIPPLTLTEWEQAFDAYKQYPEFQKINGHMDLEQFKGIFYWEFGHRLLGRVIGLVYFIPFVIFLALGRIEKRWKPQLMIAFVLGGLQGLMGWYMVKSGLVDVPRVSHFRLAAHLLLAILILAFLFWLILDLMEVKRPGVPSGLQRLAVLMLVVLALQLLLGAFTAGLDAGYFLNTYPLMDGQWLADAAVMMEPFWRNFIENGVMIQFMHRWVGALLLIGVVGLAFETARNGMLFPAIVLVVVTATQFGIGVATLMLRVPVVLGSLHQAVACLMVLALVYLVYVTRNPRAPSGFTG
jgi:cytochrome c oxidase assembly protein subunit 15